MNAVVGFSNFLLTLWDGEQPESVQWSPDVVHREFLTSRTVYHVVRRELFTGYGLPVPAEPRSKRLINLR